MPNHVSNNLTIEGTNKDLNAFLKKHIVLVDRTDCEGKPVVEYGEHVKDQEFDFNTVSRCPKELYDVSSPIRTEKDIVKLQNSDAFNSQEDKLEAIETAKRMIELGESNSVKYGYANWYEFCREEWGTKWSAYDLHMNSEAIEGADLDKGFIGMYFNTAWTPPIPVMEKLAEMYPALTFTMSSLEGGVGLAMTCVWSEGELASEETFDGDAGFEFANEEFGYDYVKCPKCNAWMQDECWDCEMADKE